MKKSFVMQHDEKDCGAACFSTICQYYGLKLKYSSCRDLVGVDIQGTSAFGIIEAAKTVGMKAEAYGCDIKELVDAVKNNEIKLPIIANILNEAYLTHFVVVYKITEKHIFLADPAVEKIRKERIEYFDKIFLGYIITFEKSSLFEKKNERKGDYIYYLNFIYSQKGKLITSFILTIIIILVSLSCILVLQGMFNEKSINDYYQMILFKKICVALGIITVFKMIIQQVLNVLLMRISNKMDVGIIDKYLIHMFNKSLIFFNGYKNGELVSRCNDIEVLRGLLVSLANVFIVDLILSIFCLILLIKLNIQLTFIVIVMIMFMMMVICLSSNRMASYEQMTLVKRASFASRIKECIEYIETIKAYKSENVVRKKLYDGYKEYVKSNYRLSIYGGFRDAIVDLILTIGIIVLFFVGIDMCFHDKIALSDFFSFYFVMGYFISAFIGVFSIVADIPKSLISVDRLNDIMIHDDNTDSSKTMDDVSNNELSINDLWFKYRNGDYILKGVNLKIRKGNTVVLIGESGSGKSTLAKIMAGFYLPDKGKLIGFPRNSLIYVTQSPPFFEGSIYENLTMWDDNISSDVIFEAIKKCNLDDMLNKLPNGLDTRIGENGKGFSEGEKQRLAIARALIREPEVLIFDEVTSNLDMKNEKIIKNLIADISNKVTCIMITHKKTFEEIGDEVYRLSDGILIKCK